MKKILHLLLLTAFLLLSFPGCLNRNQSEPVKGPDSSSVHSDTINTRLLIDDCTRVIHPEDLGIKPPQNEVDKVGSDTIKKLKKSQNIIIPDSKEQHHSDKDSSRRLKRINPDNTEKDKPGSDSTKGFFGYSHGNTDHRSGSHSSFTLKTHKP